jgi:UDPglucose 6-dehydrogenase
MGRHFRTNGDIHAEEAGAQQRRITVVGTGYVGLTTGATLAQLGHDVICLDVDAHKVERLRHGDLPVYEPDLDGVVSHNVAANRLRFTSDYAEALASADFIFIAVGTPPCVDGWGADLTQVCSAAQSIGRHLSRSVIIVNKSTVPIGTGELVLDVVSQHLRRHVKVSVVSCPEFLREGNAVHDCLCPDRLVLGTDDLEAAEQVARLYDGLECPVLITDLRTAEMIKYASNAFLATRISFINEVARICDRLGADVQQVAAGMGYDSRIGPSFLNAGLGFGGSCFPKDVRALIHMARESDLHPRLLTAVLEINHDQRVWAVECLEAALGTLADSVVALLGIAFKPETDDIRQAPSLDLIRMLQARGARVRAHDPVAGDNLVTAVADVVLAADPYEAARQADAAIVVTEWPEFRDLDLGRMAAAMRRALLIDGRNIYDPAGARAAGLEYVGVGRGSHPSRRADVSNLAPIPGLRSRKWSGNGQKMDRRQRGRAKEAVS